MSYLFILLFMLTIRNCITWEIIRARAQTYLRLQRCKFTCALTFAYIFISTYNVVTFLLYCYLFRQACHVKRAAVRMASRTHESSSSKKHIILDAHITYIGMSIHINYAYFRNLLKAFEKNMYMFLPGTYQLISISVQSTINIFHYSL